MNSSVGYDDHLINLNLAIPCIMRIRMIQLSLALNQSINVFLFSWLLAD